MLQGEEAFWFGLLESPVLLSPGIVGVTASSVAGESEGVAVVFRLEKKRKPKTAIKPTSTIPTPVSRMLHQEIF